MANRTAGSVLPGRSDAPALTHTAELAEKVLEQLMKGRTLRDACRDDGMPAAQTVRQWVFDDHEGFAARYQRARQIGAVAMVQQACEIADNALDVWMKHQEQGDGAEVAPGSERTHRPLTAAHRGTVLAGDEGSCGDLRRSGAPRRVARCGEA